MSESEGAAVRFDGIKPLKSQGRKRRRSEQDYVDVDIPAAWALIHWGDHQHQTLTIESGERWSVIMWFKKRQLSKSENPRDQKEGQT